MGHAIRLFPRIAATTTHDKSVREWTRAAITAIVGLLIIPGYAAVAKELTATLPVSSIIPCTACFGFFCKYKSCNTCHCDCRNSVVFDFPQGSRNETAT
jgi:hypothetical protein